MTSDEIFCIFFKTLNACDFSQLLCDIQQRIIHDMPGIARCLGYKVTWVRKMDKCASTEHLVSLKNLGCKCLDPFHV